ncbi:MAG: FAD-dependent oxidoreductase [Chloroflexota bacterium]
MSTCRERELERRATGRRIAVVGGGISGIAAALRARDSGHAVTLFEAEPILGGHARTLSVESADGPSSLDTGFLVYNEATYPGFTGFLQRLGVQTQRSDMSFGASCPQHGFEYGSRGLRSMLAQPSNLLRPGRVRMLADFLRFYHASGAALREPAAAPATLGGLLADGYGNEFRDHFLVPLISAVWSMPAGRVGDFPLAFLLRFLANHGLLSVGGRLPWRTVTGGSRSYVDRAAVLLGDGVRLGTPVRTVRRDRLGVSVVSGSGTERFDAIVLATHADVSLRLLERPSSVERRALKALAYSPSRVVTHTDAGLMPRRRAAWCSWNYRSTSCGDGDSGVSVTYHLNRLQGLKVRQNYFVSVNPSSEPAPGTVLDETVMSHPLYTEASVGAQAALRSVGGALRTAYAGAYLGHGFHEDGYRSGVEAVDALAGLTALVGAA